MSEVARKPLRHSERLRVAALMGGPVTLDQAFVRGVLAEVAALEKAMVVPDELRAEVLAEATAAAETVLRASEDRCARAAAHLRDADARMRGALLLLAAATVIATVAGLGLWWGA